MTHFSKALPDRLLRPLRLMALRNGGHVVRCGGEVKRIGVML